MLTVGLTGGIGSGKSTVAARLRGLGADVVDADVVAREVVEPGTPTLRAIADRFGPAMVRPDGTLDRVALAAVVFPDPAALADLDGITGPAITRRVAELRLGADPLTVSVFDMPLLVERRLWPREHLTVVVGADEETRVRRLVAQRGLDEADARHRIARQATDEERRAAADVWIDNDGAVADTQAQVDRLWATRLVPYNEHLISRTVPPRSLTAGRVRADPTWPAQAQRLIARVQDALGDKVSRVEHRGPTAAADAVAEDVLELVVGLVRASDVDDPEVVETLARRGFVSVDSGSGQGRPTGQRVCASVDPGRPASVAVCEFGSTHWYSAFAAGDGGPG